MRRILAGLALVALTAGAAAEPVTLRVRPIERFGAHAEADGRLAFQGGLVLSGPRGFGGWSGLLLDGERMLAVSDSGRWLTARLMIEDGRLVGIDDTRMVTRLDVNGRPIEAKVPGDAEALARVPGAVLVAVESTQQVLSYPADGIAVDFHAPATRLALSVEEIVTLRRGGFEGLATAPDGTVVAIAENALRGTSSIPAFRRPGPAFSIARDGDWAVTGADILPGGDMMLIERRFGGGIDIAMRVRRIGADAVAGATGPVDGPVLIEAGFASEIDNMEAIAAAVEDERIVLTLLSDDNHSFLQRSLILRFAVRDPLPRPRPPARGSG